MTAFLTFPCLLLSLSLLVLPIAPAHGKESPLLVFTSAPDIHNLENFLQEPAPTEIPEFDKLLGAMASVTPDFVLLPGDLGEQHWWDVKYQAVCAPNGLLQDIVLGCAAKTYPRLLDYMAAHGLPSVYAAVGDHEVGDNDWLLGMRSDGVPSFKQGFADGFTRNVDGTSQFSGTLGGVPLRPVGTAYEGTAYAFQRANVLLIVLDQFRQDSPTLILSRLGTVKATVDNDGQLQWLDSLLAAAKQEPSIQHTIVVGHMPVLSPVRGLLSSMLYIEQGKNSAFWQLLRKYQVDLYLAGEVHQTTVMKDSASNVMQVIHKGGGYCQNNDALVIPSINCITNKDYLASKNYFLVVRVYAERIELEQQMMQADQSFAKESTLVIDKSAGQFRYRASAGMLKPIEADGLLLHYSFDGNLSRGVKNQGAFGSSYDATSQNVRAINGILNKAAWFSDAQQSVVNTPMINPIPNQQARTMSLWLRTDSHSAGAYLYPAGQAKGTGATGFRVLLADGVLKLQLDEKTQLQANQGQLRLNDYRWHHVAVSYQHVGATPSDELLFFIDGKAYKPLVQPTKAIVTQTNSDQVTIGGRRKDSTVEGWTGSLDDFGLWASVLTPTMVKAVENCARQLHYNASDMELLFKRYREKSGEVTVKGVTWRYSPKLTGGTLGVCNTTAGYSLLLDTQGGGLTTQLN